MDVGFETIGNATLICHDRKPVLITDPWTDGDAYFGSWTLSHEIPTAQREAIDQAGYVWVSHGHPDHLSSPSLARLRGKKFLLPDHAGGRIRRSLEEQGFEVRVLRDRTWETLSDRIRVICIADYNQDAVLLVDVGGRLVLDLNDAGDRGWGGFVRSIVRGYPRSFLLRLSGYGDADMINLFDEEGRRVPPLAARREPPGIEISRLMRSFRTTTCIPFSSQHRYQRTDSLWADEYTTPLDDHAKGFDPSCGEMLPAFVRYDCGTDRWERIDPCERTPIPRDPEEFGDDWSEELDASERRAAAAYFKGIGHLGDHFDFINLRVGGKDNPIELAARKFDRGITFEAPRGSLVLAVTEQIFDDMLIGNFMKTVLHGRFPPTGLHPDFTPWVGKYADNGGARTHEDVRAYFAAYRARAPIGYLRHRIEKQTIQTMRTYFHMDSSLYRLAKGAYHFVKELH
jgi:hypothetical protein